MVHALPQFGAGEDWRLKLVPVQELTSDKAAGGRWQIPSLPRFLLTPHFLPAPHFLPCSSVWQSRVTAVLSLVAMSVLPAQKCRLN